MAFLNYSLTVLASSLLPPLLWLMFYLRYDRQEPEPKKELLKSFFLGGLVVLPVYLLETRFSRVIGMIAPEATSLFLLQVTLIFPWIEEFFKFLASFPSLFKSKEINEPLDVIMYLVSSGLGFAFGENLIKLFGLHPITLVLKVSAMRFVTSVFLHSLTVALLGLFLVYSFYASGITRRVWQSVGFLIAVIIHGAYNFGIFQTWSNPWFLLPILIVLFFSCLYLSFRLKKLQKKKGVCLVY